MPINGHDAIRFCEAFHNQCFRVDLASILQAHLGILVAFETKCFQDKGDKIFTVVVAMMMMMGLQGVRLDQPGLTGGAFTKISKAIGTTTWHDIIVMMMPFVVWLWLLLANNTLWNVNFMKGIAIGKVVGRPRGSDTIVALFNIIVVIIVIGPSFFLIHFV